MKGARVLWIIVILANLALLVVLQRVQSTRTRYEIARRQAELRALEQEQQQLLLLRAEARRPENVDRRARELATPP